MTDKKNDKDIDYEYVRNYYYDLLEAGKEGLELMSNLLKDSEHPRVGEVFSNMLKQNAEIAEKLMELQKKTRELDKLEQDKNSEGQNNISFPNSNVFIGSTADLQKMLRQDPVEKIGATVVDYDSEHISAPEEYVDEG